jgi:antitoxin component of RelBE/YafQ-DinJ toxin-antitoxin module
MKKNSLINIRCEEALKKEIEEQAAKEGMTFSDFIRWVLRKATKK